MLPHLPNQDEFLTALRTALLSKSEEKEGLVAADQMVRDRSCSVPRREGGNELSGFRYNSQGQGGFNICNNKVNGISDISGIDLSAI